MLSLASCGFFRSPSRASTMVSGPSKPRRELRDVGMESAVVADRRLVQSDHQQVVALLGLFGERLHRRGLIGNDGDVELLVVLLLLRLALLHLLGRRLQKRGRGLGALLGVLGGFFVGLLVLGGLGVFLVLFLLLLLFLFFLFGLGLLGVGGSLSVFLVADFFSAVMCITVVGIERGAGDHAGDARAELAVGAVVDRDQQPLELRHETLGLHLLALEPLLFLLAHRQARQRPAQHRRHRQRGQHRHRHDHREQVLAERAHRQADGRDDHLGRAARIHAGGERQRLAPVQPADLAADEGAAELADAWRSRSGRASAAGGAGPSAR